MLKNLKDGENNDEKLTQPHRKYNLHLAFIEGGNIRKNYR